MKQQREYWNLDLMVTFSALICKVDLNSSPEIKERKEYE